MRLKIGVMAFSGDAPPEVRKAAFEIGKLIAKKGCILVTGATTGLPAEAAKGAKSEGGFVIGISPARNEYAHTKEFKMPLESHDAVIYTGFGYVGRNVINIRTADAIIILNGKVGTLNEFTGAFAELKPIGILQGSGSISDEIPKFLDTLKDERRTKTPIIIEKDINVLVDSVVNKAKEGVKIGEQDRSIHPLG